MASVDTAISFSLLTCVAHLAVATNESEMVPAVTVFEGNAFCSSCFAAALKRSEHARIDLKRMARGIRWAR